MGSGIETEALNPETQPEEAVAAESEATESTPLDEAIEDEEYVVEVEQADQQVEEAKSNKGINWEVMAKQKAQKAKERRQQLEKERAEKEKLEQRVKELEAAQLRMSTSKPNPDDYYGDPDGYAKAYTAYEQNQQRLNELQQAAPAQQQHQVDDAVLEYRYAGEERIKSIVKDYDAAEEQVRSAIAGVGFNPDLVLDQLADMAYGDGIDFGRMIYGLSKFGDLRDTALKTNSPGVLRRVLRDAQDKVKVAKKKPIEAKPEPTINGGGDMSSLAAQEEALFNEWSETRSTSTYNKLREVRKQRKAAKSA